MKKSEIHRTDFFSSKPVERVIIAETTRQIIAEKNASVSQISERLSGLFRAPQKTWDSIEKEEPASFFLLFKKYLLFFALMLIVVLSVKYALSFVSVGYWLTHVIASPFGLILAYLIFLYAVALVLEETAELQGGRFAPGAGNRITLFSALPVFAILPFTVISVVSIPLIMFAMCCQVVLIYSGSGQLLHIPIQKNISWAITTTITLLLSGLVLLGAGAVFQMIFRIF